MINKVYCCCSFLKASYDIDIVADDLQFSFIYKSTSIWFNIRLNR